MSDDEKKIKIELDGETIAELNEDQITMDLEELEFTSEGFDKFKYDYKCK